MKSNLLGCALVLLLVVTGAKRVEVKTTKDRGLNRHINRQSQGASSPAPDAPPSKRSSDNAGGDKKKPADSIVGKVDTTAADPVQPKDDTTQKESKDESSPPTEKLIKPETPSPSTSTGDSHSAAKQGGGGSFFSGLVGSLFKAAAVDHPPAEKVESSLTRTRKVEPKDTVTSVKQKDSVKERKHQDSDLNQDLGTGDTYTVTEKAVSGIVTDCSAEVMEEAQGIAAADTERRRQMALHKLRLELADVEATQLKEIENRVASKMIEFEAVKVKMAEAEAEVERKRQTTEALVNQTIVLREGEAALQQREDAIKAVEEGMAAEAEKRKKIIDASVAQRLLECDAEIEIRRAAAEKLIQTREAEIERRLLELESVELDRLQQAEAEVQRMLSEASFTVDIMQREADELTKQTKEYEAITIAELETRMQATRRINETLIKEIEAEARKKAKETEAIESKRRMDFEDEIEKRRLVINDLVMNVEAETESKRKIAEADINEQLRNFEYELQRKRHAMENEMEEVNKLIERKLANITEYEEQRIREIDEELQQKRVTAETIVKKLENAVEEKRRNATKAEEERLKAFESELQRRRNAAEELVKSLEREAESTRQGIAVDEHDLVQSVQREAQAKRQMAEELEAERVREFEFTLQRRKDAAEAELAELDRLVVQKKQDLEDMTAQRLRAIDDEAQAKRKAAAAEVEAAEKEASTIRRETEDYRAKMLRESEDELQRQRNTYAELMEHLDLEYSRREKELVKNETSRSLTFQKDFDEKCANAELMEKETELLREERKIQFEERMRREIDSATKTLKEKDLLIEDRERKLREMEEDWNLSRSVKSDEFESSLLQRQEAVDREIKQKRAEVEDLIKSSQAEADLIRSRVLDGLSQDIESKLVETLQLERQQILIRASDLEKSLFNESRNYRDCEYDKSRLERRNDALERELSFKHQQHEDVETERLKCSARYTQLKDYMTEHLNQRMNLEEDYQQLSTELRTCQSDAVSYSDSSLARIKSECEATKNRLETRIEEIEQRYLLSEQRVKTLDADYEATKTKCHEERSSDTRRITDLETELHNAVLDKTACEMVGKLGGKESTAEETLRLEKAKREKFEMDAHDCKIEVAEYKEMTAINNAEIRNLSTALRRESELKLNCETMRSTEVTAQCAVEIKSMRALEFEKNSVEAKLAEQIKFGDSQASKARESAKEYLRCKDSYTQLKETCEVTSQHLESMERHIRILTAVSDDSEIANAMPSLGGERVGIPSQSQNFPELPRISFPSIDFFGYMNEVHNLLLLALSHRWVQQAVIVIIAALILWKLLSLCIRPFMSRKESPQRSPSPFQNYNGTPSAPPVNRMVSSSQDRIFGHHGQMNRGGRQGFSSGNDEPQSALVGRIKKIMQQEDRSLR